MTARVGSIQILKDEFAGEEARKRFCNAFPEIDPELSNIIPAEKDIARVLVHKLGSVENVNFWLMKSVPALGGFNPMSVAAQPDGAKIVRSLIMSMP